jgi:hypothetical protein
MPSGWKFVCSWHKMATEEIVEPWLCFTIFSCTIGEGIECSCCCHSLFGACMNFFDNN